MEIPLVSDRETQGVVLGVQGPGKPPRTTTVRFQPTNPRAILLKNAHHALITKELWHSAHHQQRGTSTGHPGTLTGFLTINHQRVQIDTIKAILSPLNLADSITVSKMSRVPTSTGSSRQGNP